MEEGNKKSMTIIIVLLVLLLLAIGGLAAYTIITFGGMSGDKPEATQGREPPVITIDIKDLYELKLDVRTINLTKGSDGKNHYIVIEVWVNIDNTQDKTSSEFIALAESKHGTFYDALITICREFTIETLESKDGMDLLKDLLLQEFRDRFNSTLIYSVNIVDQKFQ